MTTQTPQPELDKLAKANKLVEKHKQTLKEIRELKKQIHRQEQAEQEHMKIILGEYIASAFGTNHQLDMREVGILLKLLQTRLEDLANEVEHFDTSQWDQALNLLTNNRDKAKAEKAFEQWKQGHPQPTEDKVATPSAVKEKSESDSPSTNSCDREDQPPVKQDDDTVVLVFRLLNDLFDFITENAKEYDLSHEEIIRRIRRNLAKLKSSRK